MSDTSLSDAPLAPLPTDVPPADAASSIVSDVTAEAVDTLPVFVVAETPKGKLLSHDKDLPDDSTMAWLESENADQAKSLSDWASEFEHPSDVSTYVEPPPYDPEAPKDDMQATIAALQQRITVAAGVVAAMVEDKSPKFPSGLSYDVANKAMMGDPDAQAQVEDVFNSMGKPGMAPSEFVAAVVGDPPAADDAEMTTVYDGLKNEAQLWQSKNIANSLQGK